MSRFSITLVGILCMSLRVVAQEGSPLSENPSSPNTGEVVPVEAPDVESDATEGRDVEELIEPDESGTRLVALLTALDEFAGNSGADGEIVDAPFEKYVDIRLLGDARKSMDCVLLTDVAIQLAHGEKALFRSHKHVSSDSLFQLAAHWAHEKGDAETTQRVQRAAEHFGKKEIAEHIASQEILSGESRHETPEMTVPLNSLTPAEYSELRSLLLILKDAELIRDQTTIEALRERMANMKFVGPNRKNLDLIMGPSRSGDDENATGEQATADLLNKLAADSRGDRERQIAAGILQVIAGAIQNNNNGGQPYNPQPYNPQPYNPQPYNPQPYNPQPYNPQPYNPQPYNPQPYNPQPYNPQPQPQPYKPQPQPNSGVDPGFGLTGGSRSIEGDSKTYFDRNRRQWVPIK